METRQYEKLIVWQEAHALCIEIYKLTSSFPSEEKFCLVPQMRRSSYSVSTNIAEGNARRSAKEKVHFTDIAAASLEELHYQLRLSKDLHYLSPETFEQLTAHIGRVGFLLNQLRKSLL